MKVAVLLDLGNTLVQYWEKPEFPGILERAIRQVWDYLDQQGLLDVSPENVWAAVRQQDREAQDHRVRPLPERLARIFDLEPSALPEGLLASACRRFAAPLLARGQLYPDSLPTLERLRADGFRTAIISNTPWGTPASLWREEVKRLGLDDRVDVTVFCGDVGWRKPARPIFEFAIGRLEVSPRQCLFVGDDPRWDLVGPRTIGIDAVLLDRRGKAPDAGERPLRNLGELWSAGHVGGR